MSQPRAASVHVEGANGLALLVAGCVRPFEPDSLGEVPHIVGIVAEAWVPDGMALARLMADGLYREFAVRRGADLLMVRGRFTNVGISPDGMPRTVEITGFADGLGKVVIDVR